MQPAVFALLTILMLSRCSRRSLKILVDPNPVGAMLLPMAAAHGARYSPPISLHGGLQRHARPPNACSSYRHNRTYLRLAHVAGRRAVVAAAAQKSPSIEELAARDQLLDRLLQFKSQDEVCAFQVCGSTDQVCGSLICGC